MHAPEKLDATPSPDEPSGKAEPSSGAAKAEEGLEAPESEDLDEDLEEELEDELTWFDPESRAGKTVAFLRKHRRRFATLALGIFIVAVIMEIGGALPRDVELAYRFPSPEDVVEARLAYSLDAETIREVTLRYPEGAPRIVRDSLELSPGDYDVEVQLRDGDGDTTLLHGRVNAPSDGVVRVRLRR